MDRHIDLALRQDRVLLGNGRIRALICARASPNLTFQIIHPKTIADGTQEAATPRKNRYICFIPSHPHLINNRKSLESNDLAAYFNAAVQHARQRTRLYPRGEETDSRRVPVDNQPETAAVENSDGLDIPPPGSAAETFKSLVLNWDAHCRSFYSDLPDAYRRRPAPRGSMVKPRART
jgi:hypothetical protein